MLSVSFITNCCSAGLIVPQFHAIASGNFFIATGDNILLRNCKFRRTMLQLSVSINPFSVFEVAEYHRGPYIGLPPS